MSAFIKVPLSISRGKKTPAYHALCYSSTAFRQCKQHCYLEYCCLYRCDVNILGPEFNRDSWFNEKFNLGLDFPNVSEIYIPYFNQHMMFLSGDEKID